jgi:hypothetical protein
MTATIINIWALFWLAVIVTLNVLARRIGRARTAVWLVVIGLFLLVIEEPALTLWIVSVGSTADPDGMATLITPMARAHVFDAGVGAVAGAIALGYVAVKKLRTGAPWAWQVLAWGFAVALLMEVATTGLIFSRGLPLPGAAGAAGRDGLGWQPIVQGLLAWASGLRLSRPRRPAEAAQVMASVANPQPAE